MDRLDPFALGWIRRLGYTEGLVRKCECRAISLIMHAMTARATPAYLDVDVPLFCRPPGRRTMFRSRSLMVAIQKGIIPKHELPVVHLCQNRTDRNMPTKQ